MQRKTGLEALAGENRVRLWFDAGPGAKEPRPGTFTQENSMYDLAPCLIVQGCFGLSSSSFTAYLCQMDGTVVMSFQRLLRLQGGVKGCFCCCLGQEMTIQAHLGREIASISEDWTILGTSLTIYDVKGKPILKIIGAILPSYWSGLFTAEVFQVQTMAGTVVGEIRASLVDKVISVSFPINLDVHIKGCLIGCAILVAFMFDFRGCAFNCGQIVRLSVRHPPGQGPCC
ncbi:phospholipid scramblase 1-like isoform X2 [Ornithodoros turicata]|uniref:phospholipid scramblase 1-like isoform X2 n=1 Tax=Ornithodoros turicata TaxID=34597 RepID=UPI003139DDD9